MSPLRCQAGRHASIYLPAAWDQHRRSVGIHHSLRGRNRSTVAWPNALLAWWRIPRMRQCFHPQRHQHMQILRHASRRQLGERGSLSSPLCAGFGRREPRRECLAAATRRPPQIAAMGSPSLRCAASNLRGAHEHAATTVATATGTGKGTFQARGICLPRAGIAAFP